MTERHTKITFETANSWTRQRVIILVARLILGGVFVFASIDKILHPTAFAEAVYNYQILPDSLINLTAMLLPWMELVLGSLLIFGIWMPGAVLVSNLLLLTFIGVLIYNTSRGLDIHCGCFSTEPSEDPLSIWTIARDVVFLVPAVYLLFANRIPGPVLEQND
ncbi:MAG: MauE/DoxX family redox-associated membrane protein [Desulfobacteraceae bacterium]|jgi:uncharacterized membrane protein YphA (DoxX/SURF4 family)|nr:MauE/DoxX family redox-associated membrane protein [Desulfobacteraceae bacterium]